MSAAEPTPATTDPDRCRPVVLADLPDRAALLARLRTAVDGLAAGGPAYGALAVDIDRFADVNTAYGYEVADELLAAVAHRLRSWAASESDYVARLCADEFVVLRAGVDAAHVGVAARSLLTALSRPYDVGGRQIHLSGSVGVAAVTPTSAPDQLLRSVTAARAQAKRGGGARAVVFEPALTHAARSRVEFANDLGYALANDEISLHYQPIVNLATGALVGLEALLRWDHRDRGPVAPGEFVELAEHTGLVAELDNWVLRHACADTARLRERGILGVEGYVSVNLSAQTLAAGDVGRLISSALAASMLASRNLLVEVKESGLVSTDGALDAVAVLQRLGVGVSLDAFGAGGATLADLRSFVVATLKIDRSFVQTMTESADSLTVVASGIELARGLGAATVAMGVETRRQALMLARMGCDSGQGFLWSEPVPLAQVVAGVQGSRASGTTWAGASRRADVTADHGLLRIVALHQGGASPASIAAALNREDFRSPQGQRWHARTVEATLRRIDVFSSAS
jgi:diguanylate cyclase (GGDEF)-like protein